MSVGGKVIETIVLDDCVFVSTSERQYPYDKPTNIYVEKTAQSRAISEGDAIWWQGDTAFWTPQNRAFEDYKLKRIGTSGRARPTVGRVLR